MKRIVLSAVVATLSAGVLLGLALADQKPQPSKAAGQTYFERMDADDDGAVRREEFMADRTKRFRQLDANDDGSISQEEFTAGVRNQERRAKWFEQLDVDKDGDIARLEWDRAQEKFFAARDRNQDDEWSRADTAK